MVVENIARFFATAEDADAAFAIFDQDSNGDATRDEIEMACLCVLLLIFKFKGISSSRPNLESSTVSNCPLSIPCKI